MEENCYDLYSIGLPNVQLVAKKNMAYFCGDSFFVPFLYADVVGLFRKVKFGFELIDEGKGILDVTEIQFKHILEILSVEYEQVK